MPDSARLNSHLLSGGRITCNSLDDIKAVSGLNSHLLSGGRITSSIVPRVGSKVSMGLNSHLLSGGRITWFVH